MNKRKQEKDEAYACCTHRRHPTAVNLGLQTICETTVDDRASAFTTSGGRTTHDDDHTLSGKGRAAVAPDLNFNL